MILGHLTHQDADWQRFQRWAGAENHESRLQVQLGKARTFDVLHVSSR